MKSKALRQLTPEETQAIRAAVKIHGKKAKSAIRAAWFNGGYWTQGLSDYSGTLQLMRNSEDGFDLLEQVRLSDFQ